MWWVSSISNCSLASDSCIVELPPAKDDTVTDDEGNSLWHSMDLSEVKQSLSVGTSAKMLRFPSVLPLHPITDRYMEIYKPHGKRPSTTSKCTVWGNSSDNGLTGNSVAVFQHLMMASTFDRNIRSRVLGARAADSANSLPLPSGVLDVAGIAYRIGLNDSRLILRDAMRTVDKIVGHMS
jgi:hypothetical protein